MNSSVYKKKQINKAIGKDKSTVTLDLQRNSDGLSGEYRHDLAQRKCDQRPKSKPKKLHFTEHVKQHVDKWLLEDYCPEQIAGRANLVGDDCARDICSCNSNT